MIPVQIHLLCTLENLLPCCGGDLPSSVVSRAALPGDSGTPAGRCWSLLVAQGRFRVELDTSMDRFVPAIPLAGPAGDAPLASPWNQI